MIIIENNEVIGSTGLDVYSAYQPWQHASGVNRWIIDEIGYTDTLEGYHIRLRTQGELEAEPEYAVWETEQEAQANYDAAVTAWQSVPDFLKTYTDAQVDAWVDANIATIADMKSAFATSVKGMRKIVDLMKINYLS